MNRLLWMYILSVTAVIMTGCSARVANEPYKKNDSATAEIDIALLPDVGFAECHDKPGEKSAAKKQLSAHFGAPLTLADTEVIPADKILPNSAAYSEKTLRLQGKVGAVCQKKGCWLTVTDGQSTDVVFIKFKDPGEGRLIPLEAVGHDVIVEGIFVVGQVSEKFIKHIRACQGASDEELDAIVGPQRIVTFKNPGVEILGLAPTTRVEKK